VTSAGSAETALEDLGEYLPQVIICDLALPKADGFDFIRALRTLPQERGGTLPVIAVSAFYEKFERPLALELGFNDYLAKPLDFESLCRSIRLAAY
jgi:CheY-like chemotaxis protein